MAYTQAPDLDAITLGPEAGFYPVPGIEDPAEEQLWIPKALQEFEARCLANKLQDEGVMPDVIFGITRGGMMVAQEIAYNNKIKRVGTFQTDGYNADNTPRENPVIIGKPDISDYAQGLNILLVDELVDEGKALKIVSEWIRNHLKPVSLVTAVIYEKDRPHVFMPDFIGRKVPNKWLDHESQADRERLAIRYDQLRPIRGRIKRAMGYVSVTPPTQKVLEDLLAIS